MLAQFKEKYPLLVIAIVSLLSVYELLAGFGHRIPTAGDDILTTWIINQNIQKIPSNLSNLFNGNIFFPYHFTLAYSELFIPASLIAYIPVKVSGLPIIAFNFNLLMGQLLTMSILYIWFRSITNNRIISLVTCIAFGLSQLRFHYIGHLQMWNMYWWLASCFFIWKYKNGDGTRNIIVSAIFAAIQIWESLLPIFFIMLVSLVLLVPVRKKVVADKKYFLKAGILFFAAISPVLFLDYKFWTEFHVIRSIRDAANFSLAVNDIWGKFLSPGFFSLTALATLCFCLSKSKNRRTAFWILILLGVSLVLALGPVVKYGDHTVKLFGKVFIPLPYGFLYYLIPGFSALRTPSRWFWLTGFAASCFTAIGLSNYNGKLKHLLVIICFGIAVFGGFFQRRYFVFPEPKNYPQVYTWLIKRSEKNIIELPIYTWNDAGNKEVTRMLYSLQTGKNLVNGASGFEPPAWRELVLGIEKSFPADYLVERLKNEKVSLIVVHGNEYDSVQLDKITSWGSKYLLWKDENTFVYKIL